MMRSKHQLSATEYEQGDYKGTYGDVADVHSPNYYAGAGNFASVRSEGFGRTLFAQAPASQSPQSKQTLVAKSTAPPRLQLFSASIGTYSVDELNAALYTLFGESSSAVHEKYKQEAEALASTIFNRQSQIAPARKATQAAKATNDEAKKKYKEAIAAKEELTKNPVKYKKALGEKGYTAKVAEATGALTAATEALQTASKALQNAKDHETEVESYLTSNRNVDPVTLLHVVSAPPPPVQYAAYLDKVGQGYFNEYPTLSTLEQKRHAKRWEICKDALTRLAKSPALRQDFVQFRSNFGGKRTLKANETRLGGNDFWK